MQLQDEAKFITMLEAEVFPWENRGTFWGFWKTGHHLYLDLSAGYTGVLSL